MAKKRYFFKAKIMNRNLGKPTEHSGMVYDANNSTDAKKFVKGFFEGNGNPLLEVSVRQQPKRKKIRRVDFKECGYPTYILNTDSDFKNQQEFLRYRRSLIKKGIRVKDTKGRSYSKDWESRKKKDGYQFHIVKLGRNCYHG